jgi:histidine triad (HIT) family protein
MSSIFSKIIQGEIPSIKICENEFCFAFMDVFPLREGHVLVVPKIEVDVFFDLQTLYIEELMKMSQKIAKAMKQVIECNRIGMSVIGLEVPHAHVHLIPINSANDINFAQEKMQISNEQLNEIANKIKEKL